MFLQKFESLNFNNFMFENFLNNIYYPQIFNLFVYIIISFIISFIIFFLSFILIKQNSYYEKLIPYECGFEPYEDTRNVFSIQFYLIGLLFLIFDLESLFLYPIINSLIIFNNFNMFILLDFIFELILGYLIIYKWILDKVLINE
jgi:NADH-quinone oxidoreductase subunit A